MKFVNKNAPKPDEGLPAPGTPGSSVRSNDSFDMFGAVCSDTSDGELAEYRDRTGCCRNCSSPSSQSKTRDSGSGMETSTTPLLTTPSNLSINKPERSTNKHSRSINIPKRNRDRNYEAFNGFCDSMDPADTADTSEDNMYQAGKEEQRRHSSVVTIFAVWNTIMGSSLLTMAWGVERAGLFAAIALLVLMGGLCLYTAHVLLRVRMHHGGVSSWEVHDLCRILLGRWAEVIAQGFSLIVMLGANIVYWILMTNFLYFTVNYFMDMNAVNATLHFTNNTLLCPKETVLRNSSLILEPPPPAEESSYWGLHTTVPVYIALIIFPLLNFKNATFFTKFNSLGTLSVLYLLVFVVVKGWAWGVHVPSWPRELQSGRDAAVLSGMLALSFYIHNIIITIMSNNEKPENNGRDLTIAFVLVTMTYILVGAVFYICFPLAKSCIEDNMLNNFEMHDAMSAAARVLLLFQVITVYPLIAYMFRTQTLNLLPLRNKSHRGAVMSLNACIVTVCILFACFCPSIGTIIRYTGAVSGLVHIFTLPSLLQVRSLQLRGKLTKWKLLFYFLIFFIGAVNLFAQFFISE